MDPGLKEKLRGKQNVFVTHPLNPETGCTLWRTLEVPAGKKTVLNLVVGHHEQGDWILLVKVNDREVLRQSVGRSTTQNGWLPVRLDLSDYAGQNIKLDLVNQPSDWAYEAAYWAEINIVSQ